MSTKYQFKFKGKLYECIGEDKEFQYHQFTFLLEEHDYVTLQNRMRNQMKDYKDGNSPCLIEVK